MQLLRNLIHSNGLGFPRKCLIIPPNPNFEVNELFPKIEYVFQATVLTIFRFEAQALYCVDLHPHKSPCIKVKGEGNMFA